MADAVTQIVGEKIVTGVVAQIKRQFRYLSQYHDNIENLSTKVRILEDRREQVQDKVDEARNNLQDIRDGVTNWLAQEEVTKAEVEKILANKDKVGNGCWKGWCLNLKPRYQLSSNAVTEALKIDALLAEGQFETVAHPPRPSAFVYEPLHNSEIRQATRDEKTENVYIASSSSSSGARGGLESRLSTLRDVMEAVKDDNIRMVRICGMGGVGKTTMAKEVEKFAREECLFHEIPMVELNQDPDLGRIQGYLAKSLRLDLEEEGLSARALRLRKRLNDESKRILLIADNVWKREDLEEVGIPLGDEGSRCKILLTSRRDDVCERLTTEKVFKIGVLPDLEAWKLFCQSLGNSHCYFQIAEEIVKVCGGLPLAVKTIARAVANKPEIAWRVALKGLRNPTTSGEAVFNTLKVSYDFLKNKEIKKLFRLCCLFPKGADVPIEYLARYGMALRLFRSTRKLYEAREQAQVDIETLLLSNLLLGSDMVECVKMHDLVWDFALSLSSEGAFMVQFGDGFEEWPWSGSYEDYSAISLQFENLPKLPDGLNFRNLEILQLVAGELSSLVLPKNIYEEMVGLRVLLFAGIDTPLTPESLQHLANLQTLCLDGCELDNDVSMIGNFDKLEVLSLIYSKISELPTEIGKLGGLRLLDLTRCRLNFIAPGILSRLTCLEELYMRGNEWDGEGFEATFTEISSLPKLLVIVIEIPNEFLPPVDSLFQKVERFMISFGCTLDDEDVYLFKNTLKFNCGTNVLPDGITKALLRKTENMDLRRVGGFKVLVNESEMGQFSKMKTLLVKSCSELVYLVNTRHLQQHNVFPLLDSLSLKDLDNLEHIYCVTNSKASFNELTPVEVRNLLAHSWMAPVQHASFGNLTILKVVSCNKLESLFPMPIVRHLVMLKRLQIGNCEMMTEIFQKERGYKDEKASVGKIEFPNLKYLSIVDLPNLVGFCKAANEVELPQLEELELGCLPKLTSLCSETGTLASEEYHDPGSYPLFKQRAPHVQRFQKLRSVKVKHCSSLSQLFTNSVAISFWELHHLELESCESLETIVAAEGRKEDEEEYVMEQTVFPKLTHLLLYDLPKLSTTTPKGYTFRWSSLKILKVLSCGDVFANMNIIHKGTTVQKVALNSLEKLKIGGTDSTELLLNHFPGGCSYKMRDLVLHSCNMRSVISSSNLVRGFHHLEKLKVTECDSLEVVFDLEELIIGGGEHKLVILDQLESMKLSHLPRMTHVWKKVPRSLDGFHSLAILKVNGCNSLRYLFPPLIAKCLVKLRKVEMYNCSEMEEVVSMRDEVESLKDSADKIFFLELEQLELVDLPCLVSLGPEPCAFDNPSLGAPNGASSETCLENNVNTSISSPIFNEKIAMTSWEDMEKRRETNSTELWCDHFAAGRRFSYGWRRMQFRRCHKLLVAFSSHLIKGFHDHLENLEVTECDSLEAIFDLEVLIVGGEEHKLVILDQLKGVELYNLPKMTHVWRKVPRNLDGFHSLASLKVQGCNSLRYLFPPLIAKCLVKLRKVSVISCGVMEEIVSLRDEVEGLKDSADKIFFPELEQLELEDLPCLVSIGTGRCAFDKPSLGAPDDASNETCHEDNANTSISSPIFNEKIALTSWDWEDMEKRRKTSSTELWQFRRCHKLLVAFSFHLIEGFHDHLKKLEVTECDSLEAVFDLEALNVEGGERKLIILNQLVEMDLHILRRMTHIWKKCPPSFEGFHNLTRLSVGICDTLRYLFSPLIAKCLVKLQNLSVYSCKVMEEFVSRRDEFEGPKNSADKIFFPELEQLELVDLPCLISLGPGAYACSETRHGNNANTSISFPVFNEKISFTSWEDMEVRGTNSTTELLCDDFAACRRFSYGWRRLQFRSCHKLLVVFSSHLIQGFHNHLEKFSVRECDSLEVVFDLEELIVGGGDQKLVILNRLDDLVLAVLPSMTHVWKKCPSNFEGFHNLTRLSVECCDRLRYLFPPLIVKCLVKLQKVSIYSCKVMEEVVSRRDEEVEEDQRNAVGMTFFPDLIELELSSLPSLVSLGFEACAYNKLSLEAPKVGSSETEPEGDANTSTSSPVYNEKVQVSFSGLQSSYPPSSTLVGIGTYQFPAWSLDSLTRMEVYECHKLLCVFPPNIVVRLPVLQSLSIVKCDSLRYIFCSSTVTSLVRLRELEIEECEMLEVIMKEGDEEAAAEDKLSKIVFPSLIYMKLVMLPNLRGISSGKLDFEWPSLTSLEINICWKMKFFTSGCSTTPILDGVIINKQEHSLEGDINTTLTSVQQKDLDNVAFKEEGILTINGFVVAGEHLIAEFPSWSWESCDSLWQNCNLPRKRQFLITRNVPCLRRARSSSNVVIEDENKADECGSDNKNIPRPRAYDVSITYDETYRCPRLWLTTGYDYESKKFLSLEMVLEDIAELHPLEFVTIDNHPHLWFGTHVSLYPRLLPRFIKELSHDSSWLGCEPNVCHYLQLLLCAYAPCIPTIQILPIEAPHDKEKMVIPC